MILIIESGSTKSNWRFILKGRIFILPDTIGINPNYIREIELLKILDSLVLPISKIEKITIYFYGAGCMQFDNKALIKKIYKKIFLNSTILVESDIIAAALSCFGKKKGIAGILGTGSNICLFDGEQLKESRSGLGFILGDEGSGAYFGKMLIQDFLNKKMSITDADELKANFNLSKESILNKVYKERNPNLFFSNFSIYIHTNLNNTYYYKLAKRCLLDFFEIHIERINNYKNCKVGLVGSIAFYYEDIIREIAIEKSIEIECIIKKPIDKLAEFHLLNQ